MKTAVKCATSSALFVLVAWRTSFIVANEPTPTGGVAVERMELRWGTPTAPEAFRIGYVRGHAGHYTEWVAEYLDAETLKGSAKRDGIPFHPDADQGAEWRVDDADYRDSDSNGKKYDRGHEANAADNHRGRVAMRQTFQFTNMFPQTAQLNRSPKKWAGLEQHIRDEAAQDGAKVWVFTGPAFLPDKGGDVTVRTIGRHVVWVPTHCWKAMLLEKDGKRTATAWMMPNTNAPPDWQECELSIDALEAAVGLDFFNRLEDTEEAQLEAGG